MSSRRGWIIGAATVSFVLALFAVVVAVNWVRNPVSSGVPLPNQLGPNKAFVSGTLLAEVGPRPATPVSGKIALVNVIRTGPPFPYEVTTGTDGTFSVAVNPGLYQIVGTPSGTIPFDRGGRRTCTILGRTLRVHPGDHIKVNVQCQTGWP